MQSQVSGTLRRTSQARLCAMSRGQLDTTELTESSTGPQETGEPTSLQNWGNTTWFYNSRNARNNSITVTRLSMVYLFADEQPKTSLCRSTLPISPIQGKPENTELQEALLKAEAKLQTLTRGSATSHSPAKLELSPSLQLSWAEGNTGGGTSHQGWQQGALHPPG